MFLALISFQGNLVSFNISFLFLNWVLLECPILKKQKNNIKKKKIKNTSNTGTVLCIVDSMGHQRGARGHQVTLEAHMSGLRACSKNNSPAMGQCDFLVMLQK